MSNRLIAELGEKLDLTAEELADIIWLTLIRQQSIVTASTELKADTATVVEQASSPVSGSLSLPPLVLSGNIIPNRQKTSDSVFGIAPRRSQPSSATKTVLDCPPIKVANPPSIRNPLALARSLRPLMRQVPSEQIAGLDEQATAQQIAEAGIWQLIVKPVLEPWLELVLVADESTSMLIWQQTVLEFRRLLRNYGTFRDVQLWGLHYQDNQLHLYPGIGVEALRQTTRQPKELVDPSGRRLILLITDCVSAYWQGETLIKTLRLWSQYSPVAIAQVLPEWLWMRTAIRGFESVQLKAMKPGVPDSQLVIDWSFAWQAEPNLNAGVCVPIIPLEPDSVLTWSQMVIGHSDAPGYWLESFSIDTEATEPLSLSPKQQIEQFRVMSSPVAQRLMGLVAASPVITLPVIRLIQETLLPKKSRQMNVAEVLLGGLLEPINPPQRGANPDQVEYRFVDETIRDLLLAEAPVPDTVEVLSEYVSRQFDKSLDEFVAELQVWSQSEDVALVEKARPFATVTASVLKRKGGKYRQFVQQIESLYPPIPKPDSPVSFPPLQNFNFETATVVFEETQLQPFEFEIATVEVHKSGFRRKVVINRERGQVWGDAEQLSETVALEMVAIPEGKFLMGSPEDEPQRSGDEGPQHEVIVPAFFMGKYPVTQAQWRLIARLPQVKQELDPDPSEFRGENHPVENVSWQDATEFCARVSVLSGRQYRLPSEAEWEYAARAGTTTPFHFGETITPELANYDWQETYGSVEVTKKKDFRGTTPVGSFGVANAFGLYDMHGNVWEWCEDHWHGSYEGAPKDGSAWIDVEAKEDASLVLRGGSWIIDPWLCRSATRNCDDVGFRLYFNGFRVVCGVPRTL